MSFDKKSLRDSLWELSSRMEQERLWTGLTPGVMASFEETACYLFSYGLLGAEMESGLFSQRYGEIVGQKTEQLLNLVQNFPLGLSPMDQINHPDMDEIRAIAQDLLDSSLCANDE
jgi:hypothetical protein